MADLSEVLMSLATIIGGMIYPDGVESPSVTGTGVRIYPGWPMPDQLDRDLKLGIAHISIFPLPEERNTTTGLMPQEFSLDVGDTTGTTLKNVKRQEQIIMITEWANSPTTRDTVNKLIEPRLADTYRFTLPDNTICMMRYRDSRTIDNLQKSLIYRKDLIFIVEYFTTLISTDYIIKDSTLTSVNVVSVLP